MCAAVEESQNRVRLGHISQAVVDEVTPDPLATTIKAVTASATGANGGTTAFHEPTSGEANLTGTFHPLREGYDSRDRWGFAFGGSYVESSHQGIAQAYDSGPIPAPIAVAQPSTPQTSAPAVDATALAANRYEHVANVKYPGYVLN
jgi:hypothetical protein